MRWETIYPTLDDRLLEQYESQSTQAERVSLEADFQVEEVFGGGSFDRIASTSLFFTPPADGGARDESCVRSARRDDLRGHIDPWDQYVEPVLAGADRLKRHRKNAAMRVYLANHLRSLVSPLVAAGCEVCLMKLSRPDILTGTIWRLLALESTGIEVTIVDASRAPLAIEDSRRTSVTVMNGFQFWRLANFRHTCPDSYSPLIGSQLGGLSPGWNIRKLASAFIWLRAQGLLRGITHPLTGEIVEFVNQMSGRPECSADAWFLTVAVFPLMARAGLLTILSPEMAYHHWNALDINFCVRQNQNSEITFSDIGLWRKPVMIKRY